MRIDRIEKSKHKQERVLVFLEDGAWDMVLDLTRDWFEFQQVLLADWD